MKDLAAKTLKREVAATMLAYLGVMYGFAAAGSATALTVAEALTMPVFVWSGAAFGLDAATKQFGVRFK